MEKSSLCSTWEEIIYAWPSISVWEAEQHLKWGNSLPQHCKPECKDGKGSYALSMWLQVLAPWWIPRKVATRIQVMAGKSSSRCLSLFLLILPRSLSSGAPWLHSWSALPSPGCIALLLSCPLHPLHKCNPSCPVTWCHLLPPSVFESFLIYSLCLMSAWCCPFRLFLRFPHFFSTASYVRHKRVPSWFPAVIQSLLAIQEHWHFSRPKCIRDDRARLSPDTPLPFLFTQKFRVGIRMRDTAH